MSVQISGPLLPAVYRYLPLQYIDQFFSTGQLQLSCFANFALLPGEHQDNREGFAIVSMLSQPSPIAPDGRSLFSVIGMGKDMYILSTSLLARQSLAPKFNATGYFRINQPIQFGEAIASAIPGCIGWAYGTCKYQERSIRHDDAPPMTPVAFSKGPHEKAWFARHIFAGVGFDPLFLKPDTYREECEFRLVWRVAHRVTQSRIFDCSKALEYCSTVLPGAEEGEAIAIPRLLRFRQTVGHPIGVNHSKQHPKPEAKTVIQDTAIDKATHDNSETSPMTEIPQENIVALPLPNDTRNLGFASACFAERHDDFIELAFYSADPSPRCLARIFISVELFYVRFWQAAQTYYQLVSHNFPDTRHSWPKLLDIRPPAVHDCTPMQGTHFRIARDGLSAVCEVYYLPATSTAQINEGTDPAIVRFEAIGMIGMSVLLLQSILQWAEGQAPKILEDLNARGIPIPLFI